jgi:hypothetical protein
MSTHKIVSVYGFRYQNQVNSLPIHFNVNFVDSHRLPCLHRIACLGMVGWMHSCKLACRVINLFEFMFLRKFGWITIRIVLSKFSLTYMDSFKIEGSSFVCFYRGVTSEIAWAGSKRFDFLLFPFVYLSLDCLTWWAFFFFRSWLVFSVCWYPPSL